MSGFISLGCGLTTTAISATTNAFFTTTSILSFTAGRPFAALCLFRCAVDLASFYSPKETITVTNEVQKYAQEAFKSLKSKIDIGKHFDRFSFWKHHTFMKVTSFLDTKIPQSFALRLLALSYYFGNTDLTDIKDLNYGNFFGFLSYFRISLVYLSRQIYYGLNPHYENKPIVNNIATSVRTAAAQANISKEKKPLDSIMGRAKEHLENHQATKSETPLTYREFISSTTKWIALTGISWYPPLYFLSTATSIIPDPLNSLITAAAVAWYMNRLLASKSQELLQQPAPKTKNSEALATQISNTVKNLPATEDQKRDFAARIKKLDLHGDAPFPPVGGQALQIEGDVIADLCRFLLNWIYPGKQPAQPVRQEQPAQPVRQEQPAQPVRQEQPAQPVHQEQNAQPAPEGSNASQRPAQPDADVERIRQTMPDASLGPRNQRQFPSDIDLKVREILEKNPGIYISVPENVENPVDSLQQLDPLDARQLHAVMSFLLKERGELSNAKDQEAKIKYQFEDARIKHLAGIYAETKDVPNYCGETNSAVIAFAKEVFASVSYFDLRDRKDLIPGYLDDMQRVLDQKPTDKWINKTVPQSAIDERRKEYPSLTANNNAEDDNFLD